MCGRTVIPNYTHDMEPLWQRVTPEAQEHFQERRYNTPPSAMIPVVRFDDEEGEYEVNAAYWGLLPAFAKDKKFGFRTFNARIETITEKPSFRAAIKKTRVLVPVVGYYEWQGQGKDKQPNFITTPDDSLLVFGGIASWWKDPETVKGQDQGWLLTASIVTCEAVGQMRSLHDRLPLPLPQEFWGDWCGDTENLATMLDAAVTVSQEYSESLEYWPVGQDVGNVRNQGEHLMEPIS